MKNLHYLLLEELYDNYGRTGTSLNAFIKRNKPKDQTLFAFTVDIKSLLEEYEKNDIVTWVARPTTSTDSMYQESAKYKKLLGTEVASKQWTSDNIYFEVQLTFNKGLEYAGNIIDRQSTRNTNKWMKVLTIILTVMAVIGAVTQIIQTKLQACEQTKSLPIESKEQQMYQDSLQTNAVLSHDPLATNKDSLPIPKPIIVLDTPKQKR